MSDYEVLREESYKLAVREKHVIVSRGTGLFNHDSVLVITLNRPNRSNSMSLGMGRLVTEALVRAEADSTITLVVLNAVGKSYSGGADMAETSTLPAPGSRSALEERQRIFMDKQYLPFCNAMINLSKPVIAVVKGFCIGVMFLALGLCDLVYSTQDAVFDSPMIKLGLGPEAGSSHTFVRILGRQRASELFLRNQRLRAQELQEYGLINAVFDSEQKLNEHVAQVLNQLTTLDRTSLLQAKRLLNEGEREILKLTFALEAQNLFERTTSDKIQGILKNYLASLSKTKPRL